MVHLDLEKYSLLKDMIRLTTTSKKLVFGAVCKGEPVSPHRPSSCSYLLENLKTPELGGIPRDDIYTVLKNDITKEAKQRRDYGFPDGETAALSKHMDYSNSNLHTCLVFLFFFHWFNWSPDSSRSFPSLSSSLLIPSRSKVFKDLPCLKFTLAGADMCKHHLKNFELQEDIQKTHVAKEFWYIFIYVFHFVNQHTKDICRKRVLI